MLPFSFQFRPPRHPLLRALLAVTGLVMLAFFAAFGVIIAALVLIGFGVRRLLQSGTVSPPREPRVRPASPDVIEGEFSVVHKSRAGLSPR